MGLVKRKLKEFEFDNKSCQIEVNQNDSVHIHIDSFRLNLSKKEFKQLAKTIEKSGEKFQKKKKKMILDAKQKRKLGRFIENLESNDMNYVIPRGYYGLPNETTGDIDFLVENMDKSSELALKAGFEYDQERNLAKRVAKLGFSGLKKPRKAIKLLINKPKVIQSKINNAKSNQFSKNIKDERLYSEDLQIHLVNHLSHKSTLDGSKVPVNPKFISEMLSNYRTVSQDKLSFKIPSKSAELSHLVARGVFDYNGIFKQYYKQKIFSLWSEMSEKEKKKTESLLEYIFFDASDLVINSIKEKKLDTLKSNLKSYKEY